MLTRDGQTKRITYGHIEKHILYKTMYLSYVALDIEVSEKISQA